VAKQNEYCPHCHCLIPGLLYHRPTCPVCNAEVPGDVIRLWCCDICGKEIPAGARVIGVRIDRDTAVTPNQSIMLRQLLICGDCAEKNIDHLPWRK